MSLPRPLSESLGLPDVFPHEEVPAACSVACLPPVRLPFSPHPSRLPADLRSRAPPACPFHRAAWRTASRQRRCSTASSTRGPLPTWVSRRSASSASPSPTSRPASTRSTASRTGARWAGCRAGGRPGLLVPPTCACPLLCPRAACRPSPAQVPTHQLHRCPAPSRAGPSPAAAGPRPPAGSQAQGA